jgi:hypothetical protein
MISLGLVDLVETLLKQLLGAVAGYSHIHP